MKQSFVFSTILLILASVVVPSFAQSPIAMPSDTEITQEIPTSVSSKMIMPSKPQMEVLGQDHAYTVTFRGNGEAIVNAKIAFSNFSGEPMTSLSLKAPSIKTSDFISYQVIRDPVCINYEPQRYDSLIGRYIPDKPVCIEYQEPNYFDYWYGGSQAYYKRAEVRLANDTIVINLPEKVKSNATGSVILYFRTAEYTKKTWFGNYEYSFDILKTEDTIRNLTVGVTTDSGWKLKGAQADVQYGISGSMPTLQMRTDSVSKGFSSTQFDNYYQQIGSGQIVKNATFLQPLDGYIVTGAYAKTSFNLYLKEIILAVLCIISVLVGVPVLGFQLYRFFTKPNVVRGTVSRKFSGFHTFTLIFILSFVSSLLMSVYTGLLYFVTTTFSNWYYMPNMPFVFLFLAILSLAVIALLLIGPALFVGIKKGLWWGAGTAGLTIVWLMIFGGLFILFISLSSLTAQPVPYYGSPIIMDKGVQFDNTVKTK